MITKTPETRKAAAKRAKNSSALETGQTTKGRPRKNSENGGHYRKHSRDQATTGRRAS